MLLHFLLICAKALSRLQDIPASDQFFILSLDMLNSLLDLSHEREKGGSINSELAHMIAKTLAEVKDADRRESLCDKLDMFF